MRRTMAVLATLAVAGATLLVAGSGSNAGAVGSVTVNPSTNLIDGSVVTVSWTGLTPNATPSIVQCKNAPTTGAGGADCEFLTLQVAIDSSNGAGAGSDTFTVRDTGGLLAINDRTEVACDSTHVGAIMVLDNPNDPSTGAYAPITCTDPVTPVSGQELLSCTGVSKIVKLNPAMGSGSAKYVKASGKDSAGDLTEYQTASTIEADSTECAVDPGISTEIAGTDSSKPNPFDDQVNGAATLTTSGPLAKSTITLAGSATCQVQPQGGVNDDYPQAYPLTGKFQVKFDQLDAKGKQIQLQAYVTLGRDGSDPDPSHYSLDGTVAKGPGVGGHLHATVRLWPTSSTKNVNPAECDDADVTDDGDNATITEMGLRLADGADQNTAVDPLVVSLGG